MRRMRFCFIRVLLRRGEYSIYRMRSTGRIGKATPAGATPSAPESSIAGPCRRTRRERRCMGCPLPTRCGRSFTIKRSFAVMVGKWRGPGMSFSHSVKRCSGQASPRFRFLASPCVTGTRSCARRTIALLARKATRLTMHSRRGRERIRDLFAPQKCCAAPPRSIWCAAGRA